MGIFNKVQVKKPDHSYFDMSYDHKLSLRMGRLIPVHLQECLPRAKFTVSSEAMFRMMPMLAPMMHKVDIYMHTFFVPNRIVWPGWEDFIAPKTENAVPPAFPVLDNSVLGTIAPSSLADYMGLPVNVDINSSLSHGVNAIPFAAYQAIYNEYYRDQNLSNEVDYVLQNGVQGATETGELIAMRIRAWEHDYFTSCLPFVQKGVDVSVPIDIYSNPNGLNVELDNGSLNPWLVKDTSGGPVGTTNPIGSDALGNLQDDVTHTQITLDPNDTLRVDFTTDNNGAGPDTVSVESSINDLRTAVAIQKWLERAARVGTRYIEVLKGFFNVNSSDKRLQRPEYIGGSKSTMAISEVLQTSATETETPQANMAGHGISINAGKDAEFFCEEHGYMFTILSIRPKTAYQQGLPKLFSKVADKFQYYWPDLAKLGEEAVLNKEIFLDNGQPTNNDETFGYLPRYTDYRYNSGRVSGQMRDTLNFWHMGRIFASPPLLNNNFIACRPTDRVFAVDDPNEDNIVAHIYMKIQARRPMPKYGNPGGLG